MYMEGFSKEKFRWAGALWVNPRGVGWSYQLKNVPEAEYMKFSRKRFIVRQMGSLFVHLIVLDACLWVLRNGLVPGRRSDEEIKEITQVRWAAIQTLITTMTYATCYIPWLAVSIVGVAFGLSEPKVSLSNLQASRDDLSLLLACLLTMDAGLASFLWPYSKLHHGRLLLGHVLASSIAQAGARLRPFPRQRLEDPS